QVYRNPRAHLSKEPGRDHLWLTRPEWRSLVPSSARKGQRFPVPKPLVDRLCRRYLIDLVRVGGEGGPRRPEDTQAEELSLTVEESTPAGLRLRLDGSARFRTRGPEHGAPGKQGRVDDFRLQGLLRYDRGMRTITRFDLVALCPTGHYDQAGKEIVPLGVAFRLTPGTTPADRVRPHSFHAGYFAKAR